MMFYVCKNQKKGAIEKKWLKGYRGGCHIFDVHIYKKKKNN